MASKKTSIFSGRGSGHYGDPTGMARDGRRSERLRTPGSLPAELRDAALRPDGPASASRAEGDAVVILPVQRLPGRAVVRRDVGPRRADGDPSVGRPGDARAE